MSTQSTKTRVWNDITLVKHTRPYRLAVIELVFTNSGQAPTVRTVFSEFGNNVVSTPTRVSAATYTLNVQSSVFKNTANVAIAANITYNATTVGGIYTDMFATAYFNSSSYNQLRILTATFAGALTTDLIGKVFITIKEYYG